eukprot:688162-Hanusia_phi.AAC.2
MHGIIHDLNRPSSFSSSRKIKRSNPNIRVRYRKPISSSFSTSGGSNGTGEVCIASSRCGLTTSGRSACRSCPLSPRPHQTIDDGLHPARIVVQQDSALAVTLEHVIPSAAAPAR